MQRLLAVAFAILGTLGFPLRSACQVSAEDQLALFRATLRAFAAQYHLNPQQIAVDSSRSGRVLSTQPFESRARAFPAHALREDATIGGFRLAATPELRTCFDTLGEPRAPCTMPNLTASIVVLGADTMGDSAVVRARYLLRKESNKFPEAGMIRLTFERRGTSWHFRDLAVEAIGSRPPR